MTFVLPIRPSRHQKAPKPLNSPRSTRTLHPPLPSPQRRPSLASRAGVSKRRSSVSTTFNAPSMSFFEAMFGDDFPDSFATRDGRSCKSKKTIFDLPAEMITIICESLPGRDIKRLRLAHRVLAEKTELRIDRAYISPNRANLECLNHILDHPVYRLKVREIVWDDGRLTDWTIDDFRSAVAYGTSQARKALTTQFHMFLYPGKNYDAEPNWATPKVEECVREDGRLSDIGKALWRDSKDPIHQAIMASDAARTTGDTTIMSEHESYGLWQKLCQDEREIKRRGWDVKALQRALTELPNIQRITITDGTQRPWNVIPPYDTPFSRALPANLRRIVFEHWDEFAYCIEGRLPLDFRGYSIIMSLLAANPLPDLQELIVDASASIGLPPSFLEADNVDCTNTMRVLSAARLQKLRLSFSGDPIHSSNSSTNILQDVVSTAQCLENLDLSLLTTSDPFDASSLHRRCAHIKHLTLRDMWLSIDWLFEFLSQSKSLETCFLNNIRLWSDRVILPNGETAWEGEYEFFDRLKGAFAAASCRGPRFTWRWIFRDPGLKDRHNLCWMLDKELDAFVYDGGEAPFKAVAELDPEIRTSPIHQVYKLGFGRFEAAEENF